MTAIATIGKIAREELASARQANVMGTTSRGVFLLLDSRWVVFLSFERYRGPLTLNLLGDRTALSGLEVSAPAQVYANAIALPSIGLELSTAEAATWQAPLPEPLSPSAEMMRERLQATLRLSALKFPEHRLVSSLNDLLSDQSPQPSSDPDFDPPLRRLLEACRGGQLRTIEAALESFIGLGPGLTPSGDDLVLGFLLALSRWGQRFSLLMTVSKMNSPIWPSLHSLTSHLSASLIACAQRGQADERLILVLDGLVTGSMKASACVSTLSTWGSSSGLDALTGMAIFLIQDWS